MKIVRVILGIGGAIATLGAVVSLLALPGSLEHYSREPEDAWLLIGWAIILGLFAVGSIWIAFKKRA